MQLRRVILGIFLIGLAVCSAQTLAELEQQAQSLVDTNPQQALDLYKQILAQRPDWAEAWFYRGASQFGLAQYPEAVASFREATRFAPGQGSGWGFLGLAEFKAGQYDQSLLDIGKGEAIGLGPNHEFESAVRQAAAYSLIRKSHFDDALGQLHGVAQFGDNSPGVITAAGLCALARPKLAQDLSPPELQLVTMAGQAQWAATSNHPEEAQAGFRRLIQQYPNEPGVHYAYGLYLMESDQQAALAQFRLETAAHPEMWAAWLVSASLETKAGAPQAALVDVAKARALVPPDYGWLCNAESGKAHLTQGDNSKAVQEFRSALAQHPDYPQLHYYLAQAYLHTGNKAQAQAENREFVRLKAQQDPLATADGQVR